LESELESKGIRTHFMRAEIPTGTKIVLVRAGEDRRFLSFHGANESLGFKDVLDIYDRVMPEVLYLALGVTGEVDARAGDLLKIAQAHGVDTVVDFSLSGGKVPTILQAVKEAEVVHCNCR
jgi:sugar/nucleoside kinase (ribokinase family)